MTAETDLLPCPFCGDCEHLLVEHLEGTILHPAHRIRCDNCGASTGQTDRDFRAKWNTRTNVEANTEALRAEVERWKRAAAAVGRWKRAAAAQAELHGEAEARAERLAEVLRLAEEHINVLTPEWYSPGQRMLAAIRDALLEKGP